MRESCSDTAASDSPASHQLTVTDPDWGGGWGQGAGGISGLRRTFIFMPFVNLLVYFSGTQRAFFAVINILFYVGKHGA